MDEEIKKPEEVDKPLSIVDEARAIRDEIKAEKEGLKTEREALQKVQSEAMLSGTAGAPVPAQPGLSKEDQKKEDAAKFFKGTALEEAIKKS